MTCTKCGVEVGCGCNLTSGLCKSCLREKKKLEEKEALIKKLTEHVNNN